MSLTGMAAIAVTVLTAALVFCARLAAKWRRRIGELEGALETARAEIRRLGEYYARKEEAQRNADTKKETLHTGDTAADFDNSLRLLHGAAGGAKDAGPGAPVPGVSGPGGGRAAGRFRRLRGTG